MWIEYTGLTQEESRGDGWAKVLHPEDRPGTVASWHASVEEGQPSGGSMAAGSGSRIVRKPGSIASPERSPGIVIGGAVGPTSVIVSTGGPEGGRIASNRASSRRSASQRSFSSSFN